MPSLILKLVLALWLELGACLVVGTFSINTVCKIITASIQFQHLTAWYLSSSDKFLMEVHYRVMSRCDIGVRGKTWRRISHGQMPSAIFLGCSSKRDLCVAPQPLVICYMVFSIHIDALLHYDKTIWLFGNYYIEIDETAFSRS